ncbi:MAG: signal peptidase II [Planctomycetota bacterium]
MAQRLTALPRRLPWGRFLAVLLLVLADQWSKAAIFAWLGDGAEGVDLDPHGHARYPLFGRHVALMCSLNAGAAFGQFGEFPHVLVAGRILAVGVLGWLLWRADRRAVVTFPAIVLVLAGALGNLLDNAFFGGVEAGHPYRLVRDFLDVWFVSAAWGWDWHFPTFNLADSCISVGAAGWVLAGLLPRRAPHRAGADPPPAPAAVEDAPEPPAE